LKTDIISNDDKIKQKKTDKKGKEKMKLKPSKIIVIFLVILGFSNVYASSNEPVLQATSFSQIENKIGKAPMMLEFGSTSCYSCVVMGKLLYKIKKKYPKGNIYFIDVYEDNCYEI